MEFCALEDEVWPLDDRKELTDSLLNTTRADFWITKSEAATRFFPVTFLAQNWGSGKVSIISFYSVLPPKLLTFFSDHICNATGQVASVPSILPNH